jgi:hypothetical protein
LVATRALRIAVALCLVAASDGSAQETGAAASLGASTSRPFTGTLADLKPDQARSRTAADRIKTRALQDLKILGGAAAARAEKLSSLSTTKFIEQLAINPAVGPSTIAAPKPGASVPSPSVNWVGDKGGATFGHQGVVLLLARGGVTATHFMRTARVRWCGKMSF